MDSLDEFSFLDNKAVETLCQVVRKPGGTIANPRARVNGQPARIPNPGTNVPLKAQDNLKLLCYWICFKQNTSRKPTAAEIMRFWKNFTKKSSSLKIMILYLVLASYDYVSTIWH